MDFTFAERLSQRASETVVSRLRVAPFRITLPRGALSITFDDFPKSSWEVAGPILADFDAKATYFVSGLGVDTIFNGIAQYTVADLRAVLSAGHEIGCHTHDHLAASRCSANQYLASIRRNREFLQEHGLDQPPTSFAYTYGRAPLQHRFALANHFAGCRSAVPGLNGPVIDRSLLRAVGLELWRKRRGNPLSAIRTLIAQAAAKRTWLIVFTHDVSDHPSPFGCTRGELRHVLEFATRAGIDILPINKVVGSRTQPPQTRCDPPRPQELQAAAASP